MRPVASTMMFVGPRSAWIGAAGHFGGADLAAERIEQIQRRGALRGRQHTSFGAAGADRDTCAAPPGDRSLGRDQPRSPRPPADPAGNRDELLAGDARLRGGRERAAGHFLGRQRDAPGGSRSAAPRRSPGPAAMPDRAPRSRCIRAAASIEHGQLVQAGFAVELRVGVNRGAGMNRSPRGRSATDRRSTQHLDGRARLAEFRARIGGQSLQYRREQIPGG